MSEKKSTAPIRLTSRTAVSLRRSAGKVRVACLSAGIITTAGLFALAVFAGLRWLPAVPLIVAFTAFFDVILYVHAERVMLSLDSLSLSAEQASRALKKEAGENARKKMREEDEEEIRRDLTNRLSAADDAKRGVPSKTLSATRVAVKDQRTASARRTRPVLEPELVHEPEPQENAETSGETHRRRRNPKSGFTLIEGNKKG
ncbi:MAG: hypothetical protein K5746_05455 [Clostridiales bacterium]|nr:hypothetical protein [Clostridiales bacterium]